MYFTNLTKLIMHWLGKIFETIDIYECIFILIANGGAIKF